MSLPHEVLSLRADEPKPADGRRRRWDEARSDREGSQNAFSIVELLVVVALLVVITTLLWNPRTGRQAASHQAVCRNQLERIGIAMQIYANDHAGTFPRTPSAGTSAEAMSLLVPHYTSDTATFSCPGKPRPIQAGQPVSKQTISYAYYMGLKGLQPARPILSDEQVNTNAKTHGQLVFSADGKPPANNHGNKGGNLLFTDGHVENSPPQAITPLEVRPGEVLLNP